MPYRVDLPSAGADALDRLVELGALDVEQPDGHGIAALMPDGVAPADVARAFGLDDIAVSPGIGRDDDSVWILSPRPVRAGRVRIVPATAAAETDVLRLIDAQVFGTGLHPTTALCVEALDEAMQAARLEAVLDVGTGSGILALAALMMGVPRATGLDIDNESLRVARENARVNGTEHRLELIEGGPEAITGSWPLVLANITAALLIEMAPTMVRRIGHHGHLVLSGIPVALEHETAAAYRRLGMRIVNVNTRAGWVAIVLQATW